MRAPYEGGLERGDVNRVRKEGVVRSIDGGAIHRIMARPSSASV